MKILEDGEEFDELYGYEVYSLTKEEIQALLDGKRLYTDINEEYAIIIELEGEKNKDKKDDLREWREWLNAKSNN